MQSIATIARRELMGFFYSPIGYVVLFLYMLFVGAMFALVDLKPGQIASLSFVFEFNPIVLMVVVPFLTMALLAEEYRSGRIEVLRTSPLTEMELVLGKFFGAMIFYCVMVATTLVYVGVMALYGHPDYNTVWTSYLGLFLLGALSISVGLFFSALTQHQIVAAMATCLTLVFFSMLALFFYYASSASGSFWHWLHVALHYVSFEAQMQAFSRGIIATDHVIFFITGTFLFLFLTYSVLETKKWK